MKAQINIESSIRIGDTAPVVSGIDQDGEVFDSSVILENGPVLLIFYRGAWCPVCKKHLSTVQDSLQLLLDKGVSVIVVTPEKSESIQKIVKKTRATFSIIHDKDYKIMEAYGVSFKIGKETVLRHYNFVLNSTREANENTDDILPVPATYLIGKDGTVRYVHYDPDYRNRSRVSKILTHLE
ncbi:peroxiredoxin-like family protein [Bacteroidota bacterium]